MSWFILVLGLSYVLQPAQWATLAKEALDNTHQSYPLALFVLVMGLVVVTTHNTWSLSLALVITILGWIMVIKSAIYLMFTPIIRKFRAWSEETTRVWVRVAGVVLTPLGAILVYQNMIAV